jgi:hypothetical protein
VNHGNPLEAVMRLAMPALFALLAGCAGTSLTSSWESPDYRGGPVKKLAVFAMVKDAGLRRFAEDQMVRKIPAGTRATAGHVLFDTPETDKDKVRAALIEAGYDSVLVARLVSVDTSQTYVPPHTHFIQTGPYVVATPYYGNFVGYYGQGHAVVHTTPGYTVENTTVVVETVLYTLPDDKPIWTATTRSLDPRSRPEMIEAISHIVETELLKKGLVGGTTK